MGTGIFGLIRVLDNISENNLVTLDNKNCMRYLNKRSECSICRDTCPTGAIKLDSTENVIKVDGYLCNGCGICVNTCPNPVFSLKDVDLESLIKSIKDEEQITIACTHNASDIQVPCLGYINESILLRIASEGTKIEINTSACRNCYYKNAYALIIDFADAANSVLRCIGKQEMICTKEGAILTDAVSGSFTRKLMSHFSNNITDSDINNPRQLFFINALNKMGSAPKKDIKTHKVPFGNIEVQKSCNGCGMCAVICPVNALSTSDDKVFKLEFKSAFCTGCGLCSQVCPQNSIHMLTEIDLNDVLSGKWKTISEIEKIKCQECDQYFVVTDESALCPSCYKNQEIEDSFFGLSK